MDRRSTVAVRVVVAVTAKSEDLAGGEEGEAWATATVTVEVEKAAVEVEGEVVYLTWVAAVEDMGH